MECSLIEPSLHESRDRPPLVQAFDGRDFRHALSCFPTGIVVVTAYCGKYPVGITVNSFASVSLDPPLVLWCMNRTSSRYRTFVEAQRFTISVLGCDQEDVSVRLARPGEYRLDGLALADTGSGPPGLSDALAVFACSRETVHDGGDHAIIVGRVDRLAWRRQGAPLVFFRGCYETLADTGS